LDREHGVEPYSSAPVFTRLDAGIRIGDLELDFETRLNIGPDRLRHLARVMRDLGWFKSERSELPEIEEPATVFSNSFSIWTWPN
jgi:hypothetical protein